MTGGSALDDDMIDEPAQHDVLQRVLTGSLRAQQPVKKDMGGHLGAHGVSQRALQRIDGVTEAERGELLARRVDVELHARGGHRATPRSAMDALLVRMILLYSAHLLAAFASLGFLLQYHRASPVLLAAAALFSMVAVGIPAAVLWLRRLAKGRCTRG
jgi:hypothetical protein